MANLNMAFINKAFNTETNSVVIDSDASSTLATLSSNLGATTNSYATVSALPSTAQAFSKALVTDTNTLYQYNGGWYPIALINNFSPTFSVTPNASYTLGTDGTATTVTVLATDSDDVPVVYTVVTDSGFDAMATISHDSEKDNVWVIRSIDSDGSASKTDGSGTVTFRASDGVNIATTSASTFTLAFGISWASPSTSSLFYGSAGTVNDVTAAYSVRDMSNDGSVVVLVTSNGNNDAIGAEQYYQINTVDTSTLTITKQQSAMILPNYQIGYPTATVNNEIMVISAYGYYPPNNSYPLGSNAGFIRINERSGNTWTQTYSASGASSTANMASSGTAISKDTTGTHYIIAGEPQVSGNTGQFRVWSGGSSSWTQQILTPYTTRLARPGRGGVAIDGKGERAAWSANIFPLGDATVNGIFYPNRTGAIEVWKRTGSSWAHEQTIAGDSEEEYMGAGLSMDSDGATMVTVNNNLNNGRGGELKIFTRTGTVWTKRAHIYHDSEDARYTGAKITADGNYVYVNYGWGNAAIRVFKRDNVEGTSWSFSENITRQNLSGLSPALPSTNSFGLGAVNKDGKIIAASTEDSSVGSGVYMIKT